METANVDSTTKKKLEVYGKFLEADIYDRSHMIQPWVPKYHYPPEISSEIRKVN